MLENRFTRDFIGVIMLWLVLLLLLRLVPLLRKPPPGEFDVEAFLNLSHNPHPNSTVPHIESSTSGETIIISKFDKMIKEHSTANGFDWLLISAQISIESAFLPEAVSPRGAVGLMQIMPSTASWLGTNPSLLIDPEINIKLGCYYNFKIYAEIASDKALALTSITEREKLSLMLASYNSGPYRVRKLRNKYKTWNQIEPHLPTETRTYVINVTNRYSEYRRAQLVQSGKDLNIL